MGKFIDLTGKSYGKLTVLRRDGYLGKEIAWLCRCECGAEVRIRGNNLRAGRANSCGSADCGGGKLRDLTGMTFGRLTVLERAGSSPDRKARWLCQCSCGKQTTTLGKLLISGKTQSCGCYNREILSTIKAKDIVPGTRFGELIVLKNLGISNARKNRLFLCRCSCGQEVTVSGVDLRSGNTQSCGHIKSRGETAIIHHLQDHNINFVSQWHHENFRLSSGWPCRFDFGIYKDTEKTKLLFLLEYNGKQHYEASESGWNTAEATLRTQQRDAEKVKLCKEAGIPLEIIPYTDFDNLEEVLTKLLQKYNLYEN